MIAATGRRPAVCHRRGAAGLRTPGTGGHGWLASGVRGMGCRQVLRQEAGQRVKQEMPGAEVGRGGPDAPARMAPKRWTMRTSGRRPVSCANAGAAIPGPGGPRSGVFPSRDRAPSGRTTGFRRVRRRAPYAASCQVRPRTPGTGRPRSGGMTAIPAPSPRSRSCLPDRPVRARGRGRAGPMAGRPRPGDA